MSIFFIVRTKRIGQRVSSSGLQNVTDLSSVSVHALFHKNQLKPLFNIEGSDNADAIHKTLSLGKVAILFEDIQELELASLEVGHSATPTNKRAVVTSLMFRFENKK